MIEAIFIVVAVVLDQLTKLWATSALGPGGNVTVIPGVVDFTYTRNTGAAFSFLSNGTWFLAIVSVVMSVVLIYVIYKYRRQTPLFPRLMLALIVGGAIGNMIDRIFVGSVTDFIEFTFVNFAIFNVADIFVTCGAIALVAYLVFTKKGRDLFKSLDKKKEE